MANFSMQVLLCCGNFSTSKFHINIKILEEFMKNLLVRVLFRIIVLSPESENQF